MQEQEFQNRVFNTYLDWFQEAEKDRRWKVHSDIPWNKVTKGNVPEELVSIVESFTGIELVLPDYISELLHFHRKCRGASWFIANWGYEESKHSMALDKWLLDSGSRTDSQLAAYQDSIYNKHYKTHCRSPRHAMIYTMIQELATCISYVKLEKLVKPYDDAALNKLLYFVFRDEMAHHKFNLEVIKIHLEADREGTLRDLIWEVKNFRMPSLEIIPNWKERDKVIQEKGVMNPEVFVESIFMPVLKGLEISKKEWKQLSRKMAEEGTLVAATV